MNIKKTKKTLYLPVASLEIEGVLADLVVSGVYPSENAVSVSCVINEHSFITRDELKDYSSFNGLDIRHLKCVRRNEYFYSKDARKKRRWKGRGRKPVLDVFNRGRVYFYLDENRKPSPFNYLGCEGVVVSTSMRDGLVLSVSMDDGALITTPSERFEIRSIAEQHYMKDGLKYKPVGRWSRFYFVGDTEFAPTSHFPWLSTLVKLPKEDA